MKDGAVEAEEDGMQEVRGSDTCKGGEITYFSGELWWIFVRSPLSLAVNLHNFTAFTAFHRKITCEICGEKLTFHRLFYIFLHFFLDPGRLRLQICLYINHLSIRTTNKTSLEDRLYH